MATEIKVPSLGESVTEATVSKWLKQRGEVVAVDEPVAELETDKITLEVYAPAAGTLAEILADEGANVPVGAVLGRIAEGAAVADFARTAAHFPVRGEREMRHESKPELGSVRGPLEKLRIAEAPPHPALLPA